MANLITFTGGTPALATAVNYNFTAVQADITAATASIALNGGGRMDLISSAALTANSAVFSFSVPAGYRWLKLVGQHQNATTDQVQVNMQFNNDATNYRYGYIFQISSSLSGADITSPTSAAIAISVGGGQPHFSTEVFINNSTALWKTYKANAGGWYLDGPGSVNSQISGIWLSSAAIANIDIRHNDATPFSTGSYFMLYGGR